MIDFIGSEILQETVFPIIREGGETPVDPDYFISRWSTTNAGISANNQIRLPLIASGTYNFTVHWGDGNSNIITAWNQAEKTHTYTNPGTYIIRIEGTCYGWSFIAAGQDNLKLLEIAQWGHLRLGNVGSYFIDCANLNITAIDKLDLTGTTTLSAAFSGCSSLTNLPSASLWDLSAVTNLGDMFAGCAYFTAPGMASWNVNNVANFSGTFSGCRNYFNVDISAWNTSSATTMESMFHECRAFNQDISGWNVSGVTNFSHMFHDVLGLMIFNQSVTFWNVAAATDLSFMFFGCGLFNQDISGWQIQNALDMEGILIGTAFDTLNYDTLLLAWADLPVQNNVKFGTSAKYSAGVASTARIELTSGFGWIITDGGLAP